MSARKRPSAGLVSLGEPETPSLFDPANEETAPPVPPFNLDVARLLPVLPPLEGNTELAAAAAAARVDGEPEAEALVGLLERDAESVALATLLRARCLGEVACMTMLAWERATPEERESGDAERTLRAKWREMVQVLLTPREADWWLRHGWKGYGAAVHAVATLDVKSA